KGKPETLKVSQVSLGALSPSASASRATWLRTSPAAHSQPALQPATTRMMAMASQRNFRNVKSPMRAHRLRRADRIDRNVTAARRSRTRAAEIHALGIRLRFAHLAAGLRLRQPAGGAAAWRASSPVRLLL